MHMYNSVFMMNYKTANVTFSSKYQQSINTIKIFNALNYIVLILHHEPRCNDVVKHLYCLLLIN